MVPSRIIAATFALALSAHGDASWAQDSPTPLPSLPERYDTLLVRRSVPVVVRVWEPMRVDERDAWRVTAGTPGGGSTYWVHAETRTILRSEIRIGDTVIFRLTITLGRP